MQAVDSAVCGKRVPALVLVFMEGCGWCTQLKPAWAEAARTLEPTGVKVVDIEDSALRSAPPSNAMVDAVARDFTGAVPYVVFLHDDGKTTTPYMGDRSPSDMVRFVQNSMKRKA